MSTLAVIRAFREKEWLEVGSRRLVLGLHLGLPLLAALSTVGLALAFRVSVQTSRLDDALVRHLAAAAATLPDLAELPPADAIGVLILRKVSVLLAILPFALTTIAAAISMAGERTGRTLEPLLSTPATGAQLLAGKLVALGGPAVLATLAAGAIASAIADAAFYPAVGSLVLPDLDLLIVLVVIAPLAVLLGLLVTLGVTLRASAAGRPATSAVLLALLFVLVAAGGILQPAVFGRWALAALAAGLAVADAIALRRALARLDREELLTRFS